MATKNKRRLLMSELRKHSRQVGKATKFSEWHLTEHTWLIYPMHSTQQENILISKSKKARSFLWIKKYPSVRELEKTCRHVELKIQMKERKFQQGECWQAFIIGGSQEQMRKLAFGEQTVNYERGSDNSSVTRQKAIENWAIDMYNFMTKKYGEENIANFCRSS